jgi:C1A family cysteine protease
MFDYGYPHRISQYCRVDSVNAMKASLMAGNPVLIAMEWFEDMEVVDGILTTDYINSAGGHCMFIYGWNETGWKVQNSWGEDWGVNGTMIVPYEMRIEECWTLTDDIIEGIVVKKPFSSKAGKLFAKVINKIANKVGG